MEAELQEVAGGLASINNALREAEEMRGEARENIPPGLGDEPERGQFSGITCDDRGGRGEERSRRRREEGTRRAGLMCE